MSRSYPLLLVALLIPAGSVIAADSQEPLTLKSLKERSVDVKITEAAPVSTAEKLEAYKDYLELDTGDTLLEAEALRRQADLYMELGEDRYIREGGNLRDDPNHYKAIDIYNRIRRDYPDYARMELVIYQLSKAYENTAQQDEVLEVLDVFVVGYPDSRYFDEAEFRRGEILFMNKDYFGAEAAYAKVLAIGPSSRFYDQSLYKHGWSAFKQGFYDAGVESFLTLLDRNLPSENEAATIARIDGMTRAERELFDDTLRVLGLIFSYEQGAETIAQYMQTRPESQYAWLLYQGLGELYLEKERYIDAARVYEAFAADYPMHRQAPVFQADAIEAYRSGNFPSLVLEGKQNYVQTYGLDAAYWQVWQPSERPEVVASLKQDLSDLAQYDHARAQKDKDALAYAAAAGWYRRYIEYFPDDPDTAERNFLLGEVLLESGQPAEAMTAYRSASYDYPGFTKAAEAGYAAVLASRAYASTLSGEDAEQWSDDQIREDLKFAMAYPDHKETPNVLVNSSEQLFAADRFAAASIVAGQLITHYPKVDVELRRVSWRVVAHARFDDASYANAEQAYRELLALKLDKKEQGEVNERIAASIYRQAEADQAAGNVDAAVANYLRIDDGSDIKPTAVFDAATLLLVSERWSDSIPVLEQFRSDYPKHELVNDVSQKLAFSYLQAGMVLAAATEFEALAANGAIDPETQREVLWQSAELYQKQGDLNGAKRSYTQFTKQFPEPMAESLEARYRLSNIALEQNDAAARIAMLNAIIKQDAKAGSERSERSKYLAAKASLELADPYWGRFAEVKLTAPLKKSLKKKKARMEEALTAFNGAAEYGVAEVSTVATFRVAELYYQLAQDLMASERPKGLNEMELEQYEILLEEQAFPFEEQAIEIYEVNVARAAGGVYDEAVRSSYARLATLMPGRYAKTERTESYALLTD